MAFLLAAFYKLNARYVRNRSKIIALKVAANQGAVQEDRLVHVCTPEIHVFQGASYKFRPESICPIKIRLLESAVHEDRVHKIRTLENVVREYAIKHDCILEATLIGFTSAKPLNT